LAHRNKLGMKSHHNIFASASFTYAAIWQATEKQVYNLILGDASCRKLNFLAFIVLSCKLSGVEFSDVELRLDLRESCLLRKEFESTASMDWKDTGRKSIKEKVLCIWDSIAIFNMVPANSFKALQSNP
jgi:hypothetical protein